MASRRSRERQNSRPWEQEPEDHRHDGDFPPMDERDDVIEAIRARYGIKG